jgi:hypothetical protein
MLESTDDAGQRERGTDAGHDAQHDEYVDTHADCGHESTDGIEEKNEPDGETRTDNKGEFTAGDRVLRERRTDLVLFLHDERHIERIVQHVGQIHGLALGKLARDLGRITIDLLLDAGGRVELVVEHDGETAPTAGALALLCDGLGHNRELPAAFVGETENDLEPAKVVHDRIGI